MEEAMKMKQKVKLSEITTAIEFHPHELSSYLDTHTGEIVTITDEEFYAAESDEPLADYPEWQQENILKAKELLNDCDNQFIGLPTRFDFDDYGLMERFVRTIENWFF